MPHDTHPDARPLSVEVTLPASGDLARDEWWGDPILATRAQYRANRGPIDDRMVVSVTVFSESGMTNRTWFDRRYFVAAGLDSSLPPEWVPDAPDWFWDAVAAMHVTAKAGV